MAFEINDYQARVLMQMYERYEKELKDGNKYRKNSVLFSILKMTNNNRHKFHRAVAEEFIDLPTALYLIDIGLIRETDEKGKYSFTGRGLEYTEVEILCRKDYFDALDSEYFDVFENISINDRERIILLTMFALRTFSSKATIDMSESTGVRDAWWKIMLEINKLLLENDVIDASNSLESYGDKELYEHKASHMIRHSDILPRATKGIFSKTGKSEYYLSIFENDIPKMDKLVNILELIFEKKHDDLTLSAFSSKMRSFCRIHALEVGIPFEESYYDSKFDETISLAFDLLRLRYGNNLTY